MTYGYYSSPAGPSQDNLYTLSKNLLISVANERIGAPSRPLLFIAHSLGGILTKFALRISQDCTGGADAWMKAVRESAVGVIFFATPHSGSELASWGELLRRMASVFTVTNPKLLAALNSQADNGQLEELRTSFVKMLGPSSEGKFRVFSFRETKPLVVPLASSDIASEWATGRTVAANHRDICRFVDANDAKYTMFIQELKRFLDDVKQAGAKLGRPPPQTLLTPDVRIFLRSQASPHDKSCEWILSHPKFEDWIQSKDIHTIHVVGEPGCGKSTAAAWLFRNCRHWCPESRRCAIFSFQSGRKDNNSSSAWTSFDGQLAGEDVSGVEGSREWSHAHLVAEDRFPSRLKGISAVYLIDAVDECDQKTTGDFLQSLSELVRQSETGPAKVLLFSRHTMLSKIDACFKPSVVHRIELNSEEEQIRNVQKYIKAGVEILCDSRPGLSEFQQHMFDELVERSSGIYLLPALTLEALAKSKGSPAEIRKILGGLPQNLQAIYSDALRKVSHQDRERVSCMLLWLVFAVRPLRESEISAAIEFCCAKRDFNSLKDLDDEVSRDILGTSGISELVGPLIKTTADGFVSVVHSSAREYILALASRSDSGAGVSSEENSWVWEGLISGSGAGLDLPTLAARALSSHCLELADFIENESFLLSVSQMSSDAASPPGRPQKPQGGVLSLVKYSVENLPDHIRQCSPPRAPHISLRSEPWVRFALFLERKPRGRGDIWMKTFWALRDPTQEYDHDLTPLYFCCALDLAQCVAQLLPSSGFPRRSPAGIFCESASDKQLTSQYLTAVVVASMFGNVDILVMLCEEHHTPVNLNSPNLVSAAMSSSPAFSTPASLAPAFSIPGSLAPAFSTPADPFLGFSTPASPTPAFPGSYQPLFTATRYGQVAAIDYLVKRGCDLFEEDKDGDTGGGADPTSTRTKRIALEVAIDGKNHAAASALYRHHTKDWWTTQKLLARFLFADSPASEQNLRRLSYLVKLIPELLGPSLRVMTTGGYSGTSILHISATLGDVAVFKALTGLWRRSNPESAYFPLDSEGRHPLHYAANARQTHNIECIIQTDPESLLSTDSGGLNCLFYAITHMELLTWSGQYRTQTSLDDVLHVLVGRVSSDEARDALVGSAITSLVDDKSRNSYSRSTEPLQQKIDTLLSLAAPGLRIGKDFLHNALAAGVTLDLVLKISAEDAYDFVDLKGQNALHVFAAAGGTWNGKSGIGQLLEAFKGRINDQDSSGKTALHLALKSQQYGQSSEILFQVNLLLSCGASVDGPADDAGNSPIAEAAKLIILRRRNKMPRLGNSIPGLISLLISKTGREGSRTAMERLPNEELLELIGALVTPFGRNVSNVHSESVETDCELLSASLPQQKHSFLLDHALGEKEKSAEVVIFCCKTWSSQELEQAINNFGTKTINGLLYLVEKKKDSNDGLGELERLCQARLKEISK
ncbi:hypothetical protein QBC37DRAFT_447664 [Rhypophila decipiens]|uniref:Nephrocystin 3-like N-terminal domain-containing protein n=1 Tax=Rhypophila decipiens TaxID=261697 RepID=A0AAN6Y1U8_9PEZI|nr:hypothetical protein QBC37DRAFT_447664 [Rhypophila decipiens]